MLLTPLTRPPVPARRDPGRGAEAVVGANQSAARGTRPADPATEVPADRFVLDHSPSDGLDDRPDTDADGLGESIPGVDDGGRSCRSIGVEIAVRGAAQTGKNWPMLVRAARNGMASNWQAHRMEAIVIY
jgi:hypothetical protein